MFQLEQFVYETCVKSDNCVHVDVCAVFVNAITNWSLPRLWDFSATASTKLFTLLKVAIDFFSYCIIVFTLPFAKLFMACANTRMGSSAFVSTSFSNSKADLMSSNDFAVDSASLMSATISAGSCFSE